MNCILFKAKFKNPQENFPNGKLIYISKNNLAIFICNNDGWDKTIYTNLIPFDAYEDLFFSMQIIPNMHLAKKNAINNEPNNTIISKETSYTLISDN